MNHSDKPIAYIKRNKLFELIEFCLDNKIDFAVTEKTVGIDEYEVTLDITQVKKAIQFGIYVRENRIELAGMQQENKSPIKKSSISKKSTDSLNSKTENLSSKIESKEVHVIPPKEEIPLDQT